jgi:hypothetical protein
VSSTCSASESGTSGSVTITNGKLETKYDVGTQLAIASEDVPVNPPVNYTKTGTIDHVGDNFRVIYNEQITAADGSITVNAIHMSLLGPTAVGELVIAQSRCGRSAGGGDGGGGDGSGGGGTGGGGGLSSTGANALRLLAASLVLLAVGGVVRFGMPIAEAAEANLAEGRGGRRGRPGLPLGSKTRRRPWD